VNAYDPSPEEQAINDRLQWEAELDALRRSEIWPEVEEFPADDAADGPPF
jgi:hypothetical protein